MAEVFDEGNGVEKLYEYGARLSEAKDKSLHVDDYTRIIDAVESNSIKARQLAAQLIPRFFKFFPALSDRAVDAHLDLCEAEELGVRVHAIRGLPLFCKDTPQHLSKIVDILVQLLTADENVERDAVVKALLSLLRQDVKASLTALFRHVESAGEQMTDENLRERTLSFIRDKVFPIKSELLRPPELMERHITDLIKKSLQDVTGAEFKMFMDFLKSLSIFGNKASPECIQELIEFIESQADLNAKFDVADGDHINRLIACIFMAIPIFERGASNSKFLNYLNKYIFPVFDKLPEERKVDLLKDLAESSPYTAPQDSRQILPSVVQLLKKYMPARKTEEMNFTFVECLLYTFHHLAAKAPNATNSLCGYKIVTGQPSDRLGEDFSDQYNDFNERLKSVEDLTRATIKKLTQGMAEHSKALAASKTDEAKASIKTQKQTTTSGLRTCNNILAMTQPLHQKSPSFIGDKRIDLSWKEPQKPSAIAVSAGGKRPATAANGSSNKFSRGGGGRQINLVNQPFENQQYGGGKSGGAGGGRGGGGRGRGRGRGGGRGGWGGRGRGGNNRGYY